MIKSGTTGSIVNLPVIKLRRRTNSNNSRDESYNQWRRGHNSYVVCSFDAVSQNSSTRISQMTSFALARDLRYTPAKQVYSANSCHADRGTRWVTAKTRICGSILTAA